MEQDFNKMVNQRISCFVKGEDVQENRSLVLF